MRRLLTTLLLLLSNWAWSEIGIDKFEHVGVSAGLNVAFYTLFSGALGRGIDIRPGALVMSSVLTLGIGFMKEADDSYRMHVPTLDGGDLAADMIGVGISALGIYLVDIRGKKDMQVGYKDNRITIGWRF